MSPIFGPDTSAGILPNLLVLGYYAVFFVYGAIWFGLEQEKPKQAGWWWVIWISLALFLLLPIGLDLLFNPEHGQPRIWIALVESLFAWLMTFGSIGLFQKLLSRESRVMRYLSDSSYWLYLAHLPLIMWMQWCIRDWQMPSGGKAALLIVGASLILLISYQLLVRHTPIGWLLNGKRKKVPITAGSSGAEVLS